MKARFVSSDVTATVQVETLTVSIDVPVIDQGDECLERVDLSVIWTTDDQALTVTYAWANDDEILDGLYLWDAIGCGEDELLDWVIENLALN